MKLKTIDVNGVTYAVIQDGKPVYVHDDNKEIPFDAVGTRDTISRLNAEAKGHREGKEAAEKSLKSFEGLDAEEARKAITTVKNLDGKKLIDAGEVEKVKSEAIKAIEDKYAPIVKERDTLSAQIVAEKVGGAFSRSKFIADKMAVPTEMVQSTFGSRFKVEDGNVVGYDANGSKVYSRVKPGEVASFDEALEIMVDAAPFRDSVLKGSGAKGGGAGGNPGGGGGGKKSLSRAAFEGLDAQGRADHMKAGGQVHD